ncbi:MAG: hypothetical protein WDO18_13760 [Acidobacteriota bacterium]
MAFAQPIPRPFNERGICFYAPSEAGVYGISNSKGWIHVGEALDIRDALLGCLSGQEPQLLECEPAGFVFEPCGSEIRSNRCLQLIAEYNPFCERRQRKPGVGAKL